MRINIVIWLSRLRLLLLRFLQLRVEYQCYRVRALLYCNGHWEFNTMSRTNYVFVLALNMYYMSFVIATTVIMISATPHRIPWDIAWTIKYILISIENNVSANFRTAFVPMLNEKSNIVSNANQDFCIGTTNICDIAQAIRMYCIYFENISVVSSAIVICNISLDCN